MVGTSLHQNLLLPQPKQEHQVINFTSKQQQQCISLLNKCSYLRDLNQTHTLILKLGLIWNSFCISNLISTSALSEWSTMDYACSIFNQIEHPNAFQFNTMIRGYIKDVDLDQAVKLYNRMVETGIKPNNFTYPVILKGCALSRRVKEGMQFHARVFKVGVQEDVFVRNSLISMYGKNGRISESWLVFKKMDGLDRSLATWSAIIAAHASNGMWGECLSLFKELSGKEYWRAEESVLVSVVSSCTNLVALDSGRSAHGFLIRNLSGLNVIIETSLVEMYFKCGDLAKGLLIFERMKVKNERTYSVVISGLAVHGYSTEAIRVFSEMLENGFEPDEVVYVGVLTACSHAGLVEDGFRFFKKMKTEHKIEPTVQHYGCLVDMMGKAGRVKEAFDFINNMPIEPSNVLWYSLLGACRVHENIELGAKAAQKIIELDSGSASGYVILSNIYAKAQKWENVGLTLREMGQKGLTKRIGFSLIEVKRKVYKFVSNDIPCDMVYQIEWQLKFEGYNPDLSEVLHDVDEEEKRERLSRHSQKLAIAFGLSNTSRGSTIRVVRSVRMCKDCHTYTKLVSLIYERRIIVRDRTRFHCFEGGICSCKDYW